jgi:hypothetical protein
MFDNILPLLRKLALVGFCLLFNVFDVRWLMRDVRVMREEERIGEETRRATGGQG